MKKAVPTKNVIVYQAKTGAIELRGDFRRDTLWAHLQQIADLFEIDRSGISRHIKNVYATGELKRSATVANFATVQQEGKRKVERELEYYNLDMILSVGYRVNSKKATLFRQWATNTLREHITKGYTIHRKRIKHNYVGFMRAVEDVRALLPAGMKADTGSILELIKTFADTWVSLEAYDTSAFPARGATKKRIAVTAKDLSDALNDLKRELIAKREASELFGAARERGSVAGIVGSIFQSFGGKPLYPTLEEKAAHLLYFMLKNPSLFRSWATQ